MRLGDFNPLILADPNAFPFLVGPTQGHKSDSNGAGNDAGAGVGEEDSRSDAVRIYAAVKELPTVADISFAAMCMPLVLPSYGSSFMGVSGR